MSKEFDKIINKKIGSTEVKPSAGLWDKIEADLPEEKDNKGFFLLPILGASLFKNAIAASVIFLLGGFSIFYFLNHDTNNNIIQTNDSNTEKIENNISKTVTAQTEENICDEDEIGTNNFANNTNTTTFNKSINTNSFNTNNTTNSNKKQSNNSKAFFASNKSGFQSNNTKAYFDPRITTSENTSQNQNMSVSDYVWVYDKNTGTYSVFLKEERTNIESPSNEVLFAGIKVEQDINEPSFMSIIEEEKEEEKPEILEENEDDAKVQHFKSKSNKINYKGFWLGPNAGYEALFIANSVYSGGSFGIDAGYDFGGSWGIQSGLKYAINSKSINITDKDGIETRYRSEFNSVHVPIFVRYKFTKLTQSYSKPLSLNLVGGLDYAFVNTKNLHQLGLNLGAEYDIFTQADLMVTLGLRGGMYNNLNLYKLDFPEEINRYNYSLSAYLSVRFIDWAKKK